MDLDAKVTLLKTIADATRLRILGLLGEAPRSGGELAAELGLTAPTISHHLHRLRDVGIVTSVDEAGRRIWTLNRVLLEEAAATPAPAGPDDPAHLRTVQILFEGDRLRSIPAKRKARVSVLIELLRRFEPGRRYCEREVNEILRRAHDDFATLRRELVDYRYLRRDGTDYRVNNAVPLRDANESQEVPAGEAEWLRALLRS